jgi:hypothetical protein
VSSTSAPVAVATPVVIPLSRAFVWLAGATFLALALYYVIGIDQGAYSAPTRRSVSPPYDAYCKVVAIMRSQNSVAANRDRMVEEAMSPSRRVRPVGSPAHHLGFAEHPGSDDLAPAPGTTRQPGLTCVH